LNCVEVVVPGPWWNTLTYIVKDDLVLAEGARVKVPLGKGTRIGFVSGAIYTAPGSTKGLKPVQEVLDGGSALGGELWNLGGWIGNMFLCGAGEALQLMCPPQLLRGEPLGSEPRGGEPTGKPFAANLPEDQGNCKKTFQENLFYNPIDEERFARYHEMLSLKEKSEQRTLLLFSEVKTASAFFAGIPKELKTNALLWPSSGGKKLWDAWKKTASGGARIVVGSSGAAFAPFCFDEAIVDDESNLAYVFQRAPRISARTIAGRRALTLKASLLLGGRMPSARTYMRSKPAITAIPQRCNLIFADIGRAFKNEVRGVEGRLPVTPSLLDRTKYVLEQGRSALWIMDRKGQAGEVYCSDCGASLCCPRCKGTARSERAGETGKTRGATRIRCVKCGARGDLPSHCPSCRGSFLLGKRPGLEALLPMAASLMKGRNVVLDESEKKIQYSGEPSLILGTRRVLALCDSLDVGLIAWLDLDAEARKADYNARFHAFSMAWESCWRGFPKLPSQNGERFVLMQVRGSGNSWRSVLRLGWGHFWASELREREMLALPPYGLLIQVDLPKNEDRKALIDSIEKEGIMVMDSGEENSPLWIAAKSTEKLKAALASRFGISRSRDGFPVVTVWAE